MLTITELLDSSGRKEGECRWKGGEHEVLTEKGMHSLEGSSVEKGVAPPLINHEGMSGGGGCELQTAMTKRDMSTGIWGDGGGQSVRDFRSMVFPSYACTRAGSGMVFGHSLLTLLALHASMYIGREYWEPRASNSYRKPQPPHPHHRTSLAASRLLHVFYFLHARNLFPFAYTKN